MSAELLALLESDPAAGILATADLREQRATQAANAHPGRWLADGASVAVAYSSGHYHGVADTCEHDEDAYDLDAVHIAAEANPAHALAAVRGWRGVAERHGRPGHRCVNGKTYGHWDIRGEIRHLISDPCPDLTETADDARAYLGGTP